MQLPEKSTDSHGDIPVHLGLPGRGRHKVTACLAFVEGHSADMDPLAFQRTRKVNRICSNSPNQIGAVTHVAGRRPARSCFSRHRNLLTGHSSRGGQSRLIQRRTVVPGHPSAGVLGQFIGVALQLGQVVERIAAARLAGVNQTHEQVADARASSRLKEQRIFSAMETFP